MNIELLKEKARNVRKIIIDMLTYSKSGHPGSSLSATEILVTLIYDEMNWFNQNDFSKRDRFVLSKGHACPLFYAILLEAGFIPMEKLKTFRKIDSCLQGHPMRKYLPEYVNATTGSLGQGLSMAMGMVRFFKQFNKDNRVYSILGDGELQEGQVWEAMMYGGNNVLNNLVVIVDKNGAQNDGLTDEIMPLGNLNKKFEAFNWNVININGHDFNQIKNAFKIAKEVKDKATIIIAMTEKGRLGPGKIFMNGAHSIKEIPDKEYNDAMKYLEGEI